MTRTPLTASTTGAVKPRIALCLSGGGLRATFFHAGIIRALRAAGLLRSVTHICAVSGGSILAAHLVLNWERYNGSLEEYEAAEDELASLGERDIRGRVVRRWILALFFPLTQLFESLRRPALLEREYASFFHGAILRDLGDRAEGSRPELHLLTTSFSTGHLYSFSEAGLWTGDIGRPRLLEAEIIPVARAVAASSAFPPLFPPIVVTRQMLGADVGALPYDADYLTDGGVFDNLGFEALSRMRAAGSLNVDYVFISDAGARFDWDTRTRFWWIVSRTVRTTDILMKRVADATLSAIGNSIPNMRSVRFAISEIVSNSDFLVALPVDFQKRVSKIRTDLDRFSGTEIKLLQYHGYEVAYSTLKGIEGLDMDKRYPAVRAGAWDGKNLSSTVRLLDKSRRRSFGLFDARDWTSYAMVGCMAFVLLLAYLPFAIQKAQVAAARRSREVAIEMATTPRPTHEIPNVTVDISQASSNAGQQRTSHVSFDEIRVEFLNNSARPVSLFWVDFSGDPRPFGIVDAHSEAIFNTYIGHLWIAKTPSGVPLLTYVAERQSDQ